MLNQSLSGPWQFRQAGAAEWLPAVVPGGTYTDLLAAGRIPDPFVGENEKQVKWVAETDWEYSRSFTAGPELLAEQHIELVCYGLDTLAEISLNDQPLGKTDNMFRTYRFDLKPLLQPGENRLTILFRSPLEYINNRQKERPLPAVMNGGMAHLRKVPSHFGWDWGPILPISGVWRKISIEAHSIARLANVHLRQEHKDGRVTVFVQAECEQWENRSCAVVLSLTAPDGSLAYASAPVKDGRSSFSLEVERPQLWWPNGLGAQPLYRAQVSLVHAEHAIDPEHLLDAEHLLDQRPYQLGLRTIELRREPDEWGQSFTFVVNGVPIFAKGGNWIPADSFPARLTAESYERLVRAAVDANMNMLRVWGGGYYEDERFYDLCDRYGLLVWQEFIFACAPYPLDEPAFAENFQAEAVDNLRWLRHRACLALWCGNNEVEMMWGLWKKYAEITEAYEKIFFHSLPEWVRTEDPDHAYWPSSPSSGEFMKDTNSDARGDTHLWQVWHGLMEPAFFRTQLTRFASEFGLESLPNMETLAAFAKPEDYSLKSRVFLHHQRSAGGNDKMTYYLTGRFRIPREFADVVYLTQVMQAETMRTGVEHWRRNRPRCAGALYWQLNDCWPVTSWSSLDYYGRWKALQYAARRFFAPLALSLEDEAGVVTVFVANDTPAPWEGLVRWTLETLAGEKLDSGQAAVAAAPLVATRIRSYDFNRELRLRGPKDLAFTAELWQGEHCLSRQVVLFAPEKDLQLPDPSLQAEIQLEGEQLSITVSARALARFVCLSLPGAEVVFSDNFFDLPGGRSLTVTCPLPPGWSLDQARQSLRLRSIYGISPAGSPLTDRLERLRIGLSPNSLLMRFYQTLMK